MKYALTSVILVIYALLFSACGGGGSNSGASADALAPSTPVLVSLNSPSQVGVTLFWLPATDDGTAADEIVYEVHMDTAEGFTPTTASLKKTVTGVAEADIDGLLPNTLYHVKIKAIDKAGNSVISKEEQITTLEFGTTVSSAYKIIPVADLHGVNVVVNDTNITFTETNTTLYPAYGDVIVGDLEHIFYRKVVGLGKTGTTIELQTIEASVDDIFVQTQFISNTVLFDAAEVPAVMSSTLQRTTAFKGASNTRETTWASGRFKATQTVTSHATPASATARSVAYSASFGAFNVTMPTNQIAVNEGETLTATIIANRTDPEYEFNGIRIEKVTHGGTVVDPATLGMTLTRNGTDPTFISAELKMLATSQMVSEDPYMVTFELRADEVICDNAADPCATATETVELEIHVVPKSQEISFGTINASLSTPDGVLSAGMKVEFAPHLTSQVVKTGTFSIDKAEMYLEGDVHFDTEVLLNFEAAKTIGVRTTDDGVAPLWQRNFTRVFLVAGVPVLEEITLRLDAELTANAAGAIKASTKMNNVIPIKSGFRYENDSWEAIGSKEEPTPTYTASISVEGKADVTFKIIPSVQSKTWKIIKGSVAVPLWAQAAIATEGSIQNASADYRLTDLGATLGVDVTLKAELGLDSMEYLHMGWTKNWSMYHDGIFSLPKLGVKATTPSDYGEVTVVGLVEDGINNPFEQKYVDWKVLPEEGVYITYPDVNNREIAKLQFTQPGDYTVYFIGGSQKLSQSFGRQYATANVSVTDIKTAVPANIAPVAIAGANQLVMAGETVTLPGWNSVDSDGKIVKYSWYDNGTLINESTAKSYDYIFAPGDHTVRLVVTDDKNATGETEILVSVKDVVLPTAGELPSMATLPAEYQGEISLNAASYTTLCPKYRAELVDSPAYADNVDTFYVGAYRCSYQYDKLITSQQHINDVPNGLTLHFGNDFRISHVESFSNGEPDGAQIYFDALENVRALYSYANGVEHGPWFTESEWGYHLNGLQHGAWHSVDSVFAPESSQYNLVYADRVTDAVWDNGNLVQRTVAINGVVTEEYNTLNGQLDGRQYTLDLYDNNTTNIEEYAAGVRNGVYYTKRTDTNGDVYEFTANYQNGTLHGTVQLLRNGALLLDGTLQNGLWNGTVTVKEGQFSLEYVNEDLRTLMEPVQRICGYTSWGTQYWRAASIPFVNGIVDGTVDYGGTRAVTYSNGIMQAQTYYGATTYSETIYQSETVAPRFDSDYKPATWTLYDTADNHVMEQKIYNSAGELSLYMVYDQNGLLAEKIVYHEDGSYVRYLYTAGELRFEYPYNASGRNDGVLKTYHPGEILEYEMPYTDGTRHGVEKWYLADGNLSLERPYDNGLLQGMEKRYYDNRMLHIETPWVAGQQEGIETEYCEDGTTVRGLRPYVAGKLNGVEKVYFDYTTQLASETPYTDGQKHGLSKTYSSTGIILNETPYSYGKLDGTQRFFNTDGELYLERVWAADVLVSEMTYCTSGYYMDDNGTCVAVAVCTESEKLVNNTCVPLTCEADAYNCPSCTVNQVLRYYPDGSGYCEDIVCADSEKLVDGQCVPMTCQADGYNCPVCTDTQLLVYNPDGSGSCEDILCAEGEKVDGGVCVPMTCQMDGYNCPTCSSFEVLMYNADGSGYCEIPTGAVLDYASYFPNAPGFYPFWMDIDAQDNIWILNSDYNNPYDAIKFDGSTVETYVCPTRLDMIEWTWVLPDGSFMIQGMMGDYCVVENGVTRYPTTTEIQYAEDPTSGSGSASCMQDSTGATWCISGIDGSVLTKN
ncbi:PKD domain-containing protein [Sulfurimonas sp. ST-25]|uniref:PKD domain-containing protein n=1 Tax=Sulfurimonas sp. ST-25 TaxID=3400151 RepID=UPI003A89FED6